MEVENENNTQVIGDENMAKDGAQNDFSEPETGTSCARGRGRGRGRASNNDYETSPKPCFLKVNPYVVSSQNALDLMAKICSAEPSANNIRWKQEVNKILDDYNFTDLVKDNRSLLLNPTFDKDLYNTFERLYFAMENEAFGNRPRVRIAVTGLFNAGKSSLLNHLVQRPGLLPENSNPCTVVPAYLYCRRDIEDSHILGVNHSRALIQLNESALNGIEHSNEEGEDGAIQKGASDQIATALHHFIVEIPHEDFDNMVFIDTPGFGNVGSRDNRIANECIESADLLVYLADCINGALKEEELKVLNDFSSSNKGPIVVIITRNDLYDNESAKNVFEQVSSQVSMNPLVKDVISMSVRSSEKYWSRSGLSLKDSLQRAAKSSNCTTDIDKFWQIIEDLFKNEKKHLGEQVAKLQKDRLEVVNAKLDLREKLDHRLPSEVETALSTNCIHCDHDTLLHLRNLLEYYKSNTEENLNMHQRIVDVLDKKIKESTDTQDVLNKILEKLFWWKNSTIRQLHHVEYRIEDFQNLHSAFDAVEDLSDVNLNKLINSLIVGRDMTTTYNDNGFSVLTYSAFCGNIPALIFIINRIGERYVFMRDKNKRNIMDAAAEGLQFNTLQILKQKYPDYKSLKNSQGKTCDEILLETMLLKSKKYEN